MITWRARAHKPCGPTSSAVYLTNQAKSGTRRSPEVRTGSVMRYADYLRWLYRGGHPNRFARLQNRSTAVAFAAGILPKRGAALEIRGRRSGRVISFPVVIADFDGDRYLVSMLGENANWVRNLRAAGGQGCAASRPP